MSLKINRVIFFILAFIALVFLYLPALKGTPIWDDFSYWFNDPAMQRRVTYLNIWSHYAWPLSVSLQKLLLTFFKKNYEIYHGINLLLHFLNAFLVYKLGKILRLKYNFLLFLLFLFHPVAVITTGWMIQIKTLVCFTFGISSLISFLKGHEDLRWMMASWLLFACSVFTKSASITLPLIYLIYSFIHFKFKKLHLLIPFMLISCWGTFRVLKSSVTVEGAKKASEMVKIKEEPKPEVVEAPKTEVVEAPKPEVVEAPKPEVVEAPKPEVVEAPKPEVVEAPKPEVIEAPKPEVIPGAKEETAFKFFNFDLGLIGQTVHYYFWQAIFPLHNPPVRGINIHRPGLAEVLNLVFMILMMFIFRKDALLLYLTSGYVLLLPFLGLIPAPFMNVSWVSDQHLYLALPAFLFFWMTVLSKMKWKKNFLIPIVLVMFYGFKTHESTPNFKDQIVFFEKSLEYNPYNIPIAYNLALAKIVKGEITLAYALLSETHFLSEKEPLLKKNIFYPHFEELYLHIKKRIEHK